MGEAAVVLGTTRSRIAGIASRNDIHFHGRSGAPIGNRNNPIPGKPKMDTDNGAPELGRENAPPDDERGSSSVTGSGAGAPPTSPQPLQLFMRTKEEAMAYAAETYPWLSKQIMPDALYKLARDILFKK